MKRPPKRQYPAGRWVQLNSKARRDMQLRFLSDAEFRRQFYAALEGEVNLFSRFIRFDKSKGRPSPSVWATLRGQAFARDNYTCQYCGRRGTYLECDHVVPVSRGGSNDLSNLRTACLECNRDKGAKSLEEWHNGLD